MRRLFLCGILLALGACLSGCGGPGRPGTAAEVVVLPTHTATAVPTQTSTPLPTETETPTETPTQVPTHTFTPVPTSTHTPVPTDTTTPTPTETSTPTPAPTRKPTARPTKAPTQTPAAYPPPVLLAPEEDWSCWQRPPHPGATCAFSWSWERALGPNEYFQVQLIGSSGEHRGVHTPSKETSWTYYYDKYDPWSIAEWCNDPRPCRLQWTVVVVEWDGVDTNRLGRVLAEAAPRYIFI